MRFGRGATALLMLVACMDPAATSTTATSIPTPTSSTTIAPASSTTAGEPTTTSTSISVGSELTCWTAGSHGGEGPVVFADVTGDMGMIEPLLGMYGHAAIWSDVDGDGRPDLYVGTFADRDDERYRHRGSEGRSPDRLLINRPDGFNADESLPDMYARSSGGVAVDLDNDGDLDVVVSRNVRRDRSAVPTQVLENVDGALVPVEDSGIPDGLGGRSVGVLDYDDDGLYDLFITEDRYTGGSSVLLRNEGGLRFRDVTSEAGIPEGVHGLGVAVADFDGDGYADIFVAGSNRLFLSDGPGRFTEADSGVFQWEPHGDEDDVAGASVADVNRDGLLDLAVGHHYNSTVDDGRLVSVRLYLNQGDGEFRDITEEAGLTPLPTKAPHVELNDFDNDGWPDLLTSASAGEGPALFTHQGLVDGIPRFSTPEGLGDPQYWVAAPTADYDRDGRLDVFLLEWEPSLPSLLLRNETGAGNWLQVSVSSDHGFGIGWRVEVHDGEDLVGAREITVTQGYSAGVLPEAHFGLGDLTEVQVRLVPRGAADPVVIENVAANQHLRWPDCSG